LAADRRRFLRFGKGRTVRPGPPELWTEAPRSEYEEGERDPRTEYRTYETYETYETYMTYRTYRPRCRITPLGDFGSLS
jgi:hypothetical protein